MKKEPILEVSLEFSTSRCSDPYRNLLAEILSRAIRDYVIETGEWRADENRKDAARWMCITSEEPFPEHEWSFSWVCDHLNLDPLIIRDRVIELQRRPTDNFYNFLLRLPNANF